MPDTYQYDFFISYAAADVAWVKGCLLPELNLPPERTISEDAFVLGGARVNEFQRGVTQSRYVVLVFSQAYLDDSWAEFGTQMISHLTVAERSSRLIPLRLQPCELPLHICFRVSLDCTDEANWKREIARLRDLVGLPEGLPKRIDCPYPGMTPFTEPRFFFGRDNETEQLLARLRAGCQHVFLIGPSGSGKSSLVFAGLLPKLVQGTDWVVRHIRPGGHPLQALTQALDVQDLSESITNWANEGRDTATDSFHRAVAALLTDSESAHRVVMIIDQFEEIFTHPDKDERFQFFAALHVLWTVESCVLLIVMRADFYPDLMAIDLWPMVSERRIEIVPLRGEALRDAIQMPAHAMGVYLEDRLVDRLVADARDEPGVLPFLQEAMTLLWEKRLQHLLMLSAYERFGGLAAAMAYRADAAMEALKPAQQPIARRIFLRLVQFGQGRLHSRRQQTLAELRSTGEDAESFDQTLSHLVERRLLTLGGEQRGEDPKVDLAHEALIDGWPTLKGWVDEWQGSEQTRRKLEAKAEEWERLDRGGGLLDAVELQEAVQWLDPFHYTHLKARRTLWRDAGRRRSR